MRSTFLAVSVAAGMLVAAVVPLGTGAPAPAMPGLDKTTLTVMFAPGAMPADLDAFAAARGAQVEDRWDVLEGAVLTVPGPGEGDALLAALRALPEVAAADFDFQYRVHLTPNDPRFPSQWGPRAIKLPEAWSLLQEEGLPAYGSHAARVAVLDTGADLDHPDLAANICAERNFLGPGPAEDDNDHGSHTAGIVGAVANNGVGVAGAAQACLLIGKVCDAGGSCSISQVGSAVDWALDPDGNPATADGAHVISMSFGGALGTSTLSSAMSRAWSAGALLVASAGNENCAPVGYPAAYPQVIAVGALEVPPVVGAVTNLALGQTEIRAPYSNCGPQLELAAPGSSVLSTIRGNYASFSGTSMAAPMVAGVAALVKMANPALTNAQLRCVLDQTAQEYGVPFRDVEFGHGKVRADLAVTAAEDGAECVQYEYGIGIGAQNLVVVQTPAL